MFANFYIVSLALIAFITLAVSDVPTMIDPSKADGDNKSNSTVEDELADVLKCHKKHSFPFIDCYRNTDIRLGKKLRELNDDEIDDYKCTLMHSSINCLGLKTDLYCDLKGATSLNEISSYINPDFDSECNKTGVIKSHGVQFSL